MKSIVHTFLILGLLLPMDAYSQQQIDAVVSWAHRVELTIPVDGVVESVSVNTGQKVTKGKILVKLDSRILRAILRETKAKVLGLQASYDEVNRELSRAEELYDRTVLSDHDLQVAKNNSIIAKAALVTAESAYMKAMVDLEYSELKASFNSIILKRTVEVGQAVFNNLNYDGLITLASSEKFLAKARLTPEQSGGIKIGQQVEVKAYSKKYNANIVAIEYSENAADAQFVLVVEFKSEDKKLHAGSPANITF